MKKFQKNKTRKLRVLPLSVAALTALTPMMSLAATAPAKPSVTPDPAVATNAYMGPEPTLTQAQLVSLLRQNIKYVFVLYQENRSFDHYFGTFPGAEGIFSSGVSGATDANGNPVPIVRPVAKTPGYYESLTNTSGSPFLIHPFRIAPTATAYDPQPANIFSADLDDLDHSHDGLLYAMDINNGIPRMDLFAQREQQRETGSLSTLGAEQYGELAMAYVDGDTIPFLWQYANRFTLFDHIFQQTTGPSTPGNLSIFGAQQGITQGVLGLPPSQGMPNNPQFASTVYNGQKLATGQTTQNAVSDPTAVSPPQSTSTTTYYTYISDQLYPGIGAITTINDGSATAPGLPLLNDSNPLWGSSYDGVSNAQNTGSGKQPYGTGTKQLFTSLPTTNYGDSSGDGTTNPSLNMTYATIALTLGGNQITSLLSTDLAPQTDLDNVMYQATDINGNTNSDVSYIQSASANSFNWGWYESGYGAETQPNGGALTSSGLHASYIAHHDGPQYFGYIANNPSEYSHLHPLSQFFSDLGTASGNTGSLTPGLYYLKGGYQNIQNEYPADTNLKVHEQFIGDDDHPAYSDSQISESQIATGVNAIANSKYWNNCAIIITWDDSEGDYDHLQPPLLTAGPGANAVNGGANIISDGPRVPLMIISPFVKTHTVLHDVGSHASVVKFVDTIFGLTPLADLPAENYARHVAQTALGLPNAGPADDQTPDVADLTSAFDPARLENPTTLALPPSYAIIPTASVTAIPPTDTNGNPYGLSTIGVLPTDYALGVPNQIPADFNPRPSTLPSTTSGGTITYIQP